MTFRPRSLQISAVGSRSVRGFTLIELLVSMTILALLVVLFAQALANISSAWSRGQEKMDNFGKARAMLNRMQVDLQNIVVRDDLAAFPPAGGGDPQGTSELAFFTLQRGLKTSGGTTSTDDRVLSFVNYSSGTSDQVDQLLRNDKAYTYSGGSPEFAAAPTPTPLTAAGASTPTPTPVPGPAMSDASNLALTQGQLGFTYGFLHADGMYNSSYYYDSSQKLSKAVAVTVGILMMDDKNAALLKDRAGGNLLQTLIGDCSIQAVSSNTVAWSPKAIWDYRLGLTTQPPTGGDTGSIIDVKKYGSVFLAGVRAFERTFPLPTTN